MVLSGYTCAQIQVASQWLWLKRASTDEEEKDAILDIYVTLGRLKLPSDAIWVSPGVGWIRVDGNFSRSSFMNQVDAFVWFRPSRVRSMETHMASPQRTSVALSEEARLAKVLLVSRTAIRHYVPLFQLKKVANLHNDVEGRDTQADSNVTGPGQGSVSIARASTGSNAFLINRTERLFDFSALYNKVFFINFLLFFYAVLFCYLFFASLITSFFISIFLYLLHSSKQLFYSLYSITCRFTSLSVLYVHSMTHLAKVT